MLRIAHGGERVRPDGVGGRIVSYQKANNMPQQVSSNGARRPLLTLHAQADSI
jgi:hypothetical protein